ncbi:glycerophosphoryl diester phosphodiesterase [Ohtaekwangia koreensis]|uniref:Glycerophosphoryl diester phosphodiesterase n=2 Tax=Ohtaekwangia koreensis TaxID=688867 RepID=A0A1T5M629_9BACT|nr:glycerophosphoryl diester phosphodiesterase [Ohtaekwangia koreensis]
MVISHRGDWRNAPENSLQAIRNCIAMGVDIVEIDIQKTKDGQLVLMHDKTLDRTTTGKGNVSAWTLDSLKTLFLRDGIGHTTAHKIPTLEEAMRAAKDYIMVNLDKCYDYFPQAYSILEKTQTVDHVILKGSNKTVEAVKKDLAIYLNQIYFMPIVNLDKPGAEQMIRDFQQHLKPVAIEFVFSSDTSRVISKFNEIKQKGSRIWVNSLWSELCAGHDDERAVVDIDKNYGWILMKGTNMVQTDRPLLWIEYLFNHHTVK